jgi:predicted NUDIX family NTP pyrophosphohydrolase
MKVAAGILMYKRERGEFMVLLAHPAGPVWGHKDIWTIPKGELDEGEDHIVAAKREFEEEVGLPVPEGALVDLGIHKVGNKTNFIWAVEGDIDVTKFTCNTFTMEWPPRSGVVQEFLENDRAEWFDLPVAQGKIFTNQVVFLQRLAKYLAVTIPAPPEQQSLL